MVTIREWLKQKKESSKSKAAELIKNTKDKTSETYNKVLDTEIDDIKKKSRETIDKVDDALYEGSKQLKSELPAFLTFFIWLILPYIFFIFYRFSFDDWKGEPFNIFAVVVLLIGAVLTLVTTTSKNKNPLKSFARTTAVLISLLSFPFASEYFDYRKYLNERSFCHINLKYSNPYQKVLDEDSCEKLRDRKMSYLEFLRVWKNIQ